MADLTVVTANENHHFISIRGWHKKKQWRWESRMMMKNEKLNEKFHFDFYDARALLWSLSVKLHFHLYWIMNEIIVEHFSCYSDAMMSAQGSFLNEFLSGIPLRVATVKMSSWIIFRCCDMFGLCCLCWFMGSRNLEIAILMWLHDVNAHKSSFWFESLIQFPSANCELVKDKLWWIESSNSAIMFHHSLTHQLKRSENV